MKKNARQEWTLPNIQNGAEMYNRKKYAIIKAEK